MSAHPSTDIASMVKQVPACFSQTSTASGVPETVIAGGTNDGVKMTGKQIDLLNYSSVSVATAVPVQLASTETASVTIEYQTSILGDGSDWLTAVALRAVTVVATGSSTTEWFVTQEDGLKVRSLPRYIRFNVTLTFSAGSADTGSFASVATLGGANQLPAA